MRKLGAAVVLAALVLSGCGSDEETGEGASAGAIEITGTEFALAPDTVRVEKPGRVAFRFVNDGQTVHALELEGNGVEEETDEVDPGGTAELDVDLDAGSYVLYCPIDNHRERGMEAALVVGASGGGSPGTGTTTDESGGYDY